MKKVKVWKQFLLSADKILSGSTYLNTLSLERLESSTAPSAAACLGRGLGLRLTSASAGGIGLSSAARIVLRLVSLALLAVACHSKVSSHAGVVEHALELAVRIKAENVSNDVVKCQQDHDCQGQVLREARLLHRIGQLSILHREAQLVENDEEVDGHIDYVDDEAAEVHLC